MTDFIETPRFPIDISYGSSGGPGFNTTVFIGHSSKEQRGVNWDIAKHQYNIAYGIRDFEDMAVVTAFHYNCRGRAVGFRFKDFADFELTDEPLGVGDGSNRVFKITKSYTVGAEVYVRRIFKPVPTTIDADAPMVVKVDGVEQSEGVDYTVDYTQGIITFDVGSIPPVDDAVTVSCYFDVPVRFDVDLLQAVHDGFQTQSISAIPLVEVPLDDLAPVIVSASASIVAGSALVGVGAVILESEGTLAGSSTVAGVGDDAS